MPNIEQQIDNNDALEEKVQNDPNQEMLDEIEANEKMEQDLENSDQKTSEEVKPEQDQQEDISEPMVDQNAPEKFGSYAQNEEFHTGDHGNTFTYEDTSARAKDFKESVDDKKQNVEEAVQTTEQAKDKLKDVEKKETEVKESTQVEVPQEEAVPTVENPIPEGEEENVQIDAVDTDHKEQVLAFREEEDAIDNETVEKLNTFAA